MYKLGEKVWILEEHDNDTVLFNRVTIVRIIQDVECGTTYRLSDGTLCNSECIHDTVTEAIEQLNRASVDNI